MKRDLTVQNVSYATMQAESSRLVKRQPKSSRVSSINRQSDNESDGFRVDLSQKDPSELEAVTYDHEGNPGVMQFGMLGQADDSLESHPSADSVIVEMVKGWISNSDLSYGQKFTLKNYADRSFEEASNMRDKYEVACRISTMIDRLLTEESETEPEAQKDRNEQ